MSPLDAAALLPLLVVNSIKVSLILLAAGGGVALLSKRSAAARHWVLATTMVCGALLPVLQPLVPSWKFAPRAVEAPAVERRDVRKMVIVAAHDRSAPLASERMLAGPVAGIARETATFVALASPAIHNGSLPTPADFDGPMIDRVMPSAAASRWIVLIWMGGVALSLTILLVGLCRLAWYASRATLVQGGPLAETAADLTRTIGIKRTVRLLQSDHPTLLVTWGLMRPKVILPRSARDWSAERARIVLAHELAHIRRGDWAVLMVAELLRSMHWFNPLVWMAARRLRLEGEQACDDAVLTLGVEGPVFATHLVDLAQAFRAGRQLSLPAPAIARCSNLERRIRAMLDLRLNRTPLTRPVSIATLLALFAVTVPLAGFGAAQSTASSIAASGIVADRNNDPVPGATVMVTHIMTNTDRMAPTNQAGRYEFTRLPAGEYLLEVRSPGLETFHGRLTIPAGQVVERNVTLETTTLGVSIRVSGANAAGRRGAPVPLPPTWNCVAPAPAPGLVMGGRGLCGPPSLIQELERDFAQRAAQANAQHAQPASLLQPSMTVPPAYPESLREAKLEGSVVLEGRITPEGRADGLHVMLPVNDEFTKAAIDAVSQWIFAPARLKGVAVVAPLRVVINFRMHNGVEDKPQIELLR